MIASVNIEQLELLYRDDSTARILLDRWASRQKRSNATKVESLLETKEVKYAGSSRVDVIRVLKALDDMGFGRFIAGRRGKGSRFVWAEDSIQTGLLSKGNAPHTASSSRVSAELSLANTGHDRIVLTYKDGADHGLPKSKAFFGKWIIGPKKPLELRDDDGEGSTNYCVAIT